MLRKFPSIEHPNEYGYSFDSEAWTSRAEVNTYWRMFQTYGDGLTQHSGDWPITRDFMPDYLLSIAEAALADDELEQRIVFDVLRAPPVKLIEFCASVVFKAAENCEWREKKDRWWSTVEQKISSSTSKEHDKRYQKVEPWNDGSPTAIYRMLVPESPNALECYAYAHAIRQWIFSHDGEFRIYMPMVAEFLNWTKDHEEARRYHRAWEAAQAVCFAYQYRAQATSMIENAKHNIQRAAEAKAAAVTEVAS